MNESEVEAFLDKFFSTEPGLSCRRLRDEERRASPAVLTVPEVERRAEVIRCSWADWELAQSHKINLWHDVLFEIAIGAPEARELVIAALLVKDE